MNKIFKSTIPTALRKTVELLIGQRKPILIARLPFVYDSVTRSYTELSLLNKPEHYRKKFETRIARRSKIFIEKLDEKIFTWGLGVVLTAAGSVYCFGSSKVLKMLNPNEFAPDPDPLVKVVEDVEGIKSAVDVVQENVTTIKSGLDGVRENVTTIKSGLDGVKENVTTIQAGLDGVKENVTSIQSGLDGVKEKVEVIQTPSAFVRVYHLIFGY